MKIAKGFGTSGGSFRGKVKIINSPEDHKDFDEGHILVTNLTDPTMTMIMGKAGAIICNVGGMMSHPSVLARELGVPCIVACRNEEGKKITEILKDGDTVTVDGKNGEVYLHDSQ